ncbi:MAG: hypothetical protein PHE55_15010, partial [Methylococcaceae bacterium]|nr:hypothetical protein [Methylococcaceae bacterium]
MPDIFSFLLRWRMRWYAVATGRLLLRHWQAILLALGLLSPAATPLLMQIKFLAKPVMGIFSEGNGPLWILAYCLGLQITGLAWSFLQRENIGGGPFRSYAETLPLSPGLLRSVDLSALLLADGLLSIPIIAALIEITASPLAPAQMISHCEVIGVLVLLTLALQLNSLEQDDARTALILAADVGLSLSFWLDPIAMDLLLLVPLGMAV